MSVVGMNFSSSTAFLSYFLIFSMRSSCVAPVPTSYVFLALARSARDRVGYTPRCGMGLGVLASPSSSSDEAGAVSDVSEPLRLRPFPPEAPPVPVLAFLAPRVVTLTDVVLAVAMTPPEFFSAFLAARALTLADLAVLLAPSSSSCEPGDR